MPGEHEPVVQLELRVPPPFCQYADGPCDQEFGDVRSTRGVVLYPSQPEPIAATIEAATASLTRMEAAATWITWKEFHSTGQIVFCSICKSMRFTEYVVADVTTLNFNLLFEIGFALGLGLPVIPIRDTTFVRDKREFEELGMLDTLGYLDFQNSEGLSAELLARLPVKPIPQPPTLLNKEAPLYVLKGPIDTEGAVRLMSTLKKSALRFRTYDVLETPRLSLQEARKQVASSLGVVAHLLSPEREGARVHNARCALIAGMAMAGAKSVTLLQEGEVRQPIDYRDVVLSYANPDQVPRLLERPIRQIIARLQDTLVRPLKAPERLLERLDLGDVAAENEIRGLREYFVRTAQFGEARRGNARLVVGRKGSGKTAIFYAIRDSFGGRRSHLILDLKPEGHQFTRFRETVLSRLSPGLQEHTLTGFWNYLLLVEIALKITDQEYSWAQRDGERRRRFERLREVYLQQEIDESGDFSERLLRQVERLKERYTASVIPDGREVTAGELTEVLFHGDIRALDEAVASYLEEKDEVWLLIDNLDKGWPTRGASSEDILILRSLLEATRKLQRQLERRDVSFRCLVFLRNDIYEHLVVETPDRGKDTAIVLDWDDEEVFKEIVRRRIETGMDLRGMFEDIWPMIFEANVGMQDSFRYILDRTLMRPRDLLNFLHRCIEVAVNRGHERVLEEDILKAEETYSEDMLLATQFEVRDVSPGAGEPLYEFLGCRTQLSREEVLERLRGDERVLDLLVWFGFLGVRESWRDEPEFSYRVRHNVAKLLAPIKQGRGSFTVHPAFRRALECQP